MPLIISRLLSTEVSASVQQGGDSSRPDRRELEHSLPRFGPCCGEDSDAIKHAKTEAWEHVVANTRTEDKDSVYGTYLSAIKKVEQEAREIYPPKALHGFSKSRFYKMMVIDGCFFLQWAFSVLGGSELLAYPPNHLYFGENKNKENGRWIEAMFFVGNQIPCIVLRELLKQTFFQKIITKGIAEGTWFNPPSDNLPKMVLYLLVVSPELGEISSTWLNIKNCMFCRRRGKESYFPKNPSDLLDATYCWVLGSSANLDHVVRDSTTTTTAGDNDDIDLEAGKEESDSKERFQSATELKLSGIKFAKTEWGIRKTYFSTLWLFYGRLRMSPFIFDGNSELMLQYFKDYEAAQKRDKNAHEVVSYLGFMKDLIQTPMDVDLLQRRGVIILKDDMDKNKLPRMLRRLCSSEEIPLTQNLRLAKMRAKHYTGPERQAVINVTLLLTLIQTVVTIVSLNIPGK